MKKAKKANRALSFALTFLMVVTMLPFTTMTAHAKVKKYPVWIQGIQVTEKKLNNVLGDTGVPTVQFIPSKDGENAKLILNDAIIEHDDRENAMGIESEINLDLILKGKNTIKKQYTRYKNFGIDMKGKDLYIGGDGSLRVEVNGGVANKGIKCRKLTMDGSGDVYVQALNSAVEVDRFVMNSGEFQSHTFIDEAANGISCDDIQVNGGTLIARANGQGLSSEPDLSGYRDGEGPRVFVSSVENLKEENHYVRELKSGFRISSRDNKFVSISPAKYGWELYASRVDPKDRNKSVPVTPGVEPVMQVNEGYTATQADDFFASIRNTGNVSVKNFKVGLAGSDASKFDLKVGDPKGQDITNLISGELGYARVRIIPKLGLGAGTYRATLVAEGDKVPTQRLNVKFVVNKASGEPEEPEASEATGNLILNKGAIDFESAKVNAANYKGETVLVKNTGKGNITGLAAKLVGPNASKFSLTASPSNQSVLNPNSSMNFTVKPMKNLPAGNYDTTLAITADGNIKHRVALRYTVKGSEPSYGIKFSKGSSLSFGEDVPGAKVFAQKLEIANTGTVNTGRLNLSLSGKDASSFVLGQSSIADIPGGRSTMIHVWQKENLAPGEYRAVLTASGDHGQKATINLTYKVLDLKPAELQFDKTGTFVLPSEYVGYTPKAAEITLKNVGDVKEAMINAEFGGKDKDSFTTDFVNGSEISGGGSIKFHVMPKANLAAGTYTADLRLGHRYNSKNIGISFTVTEAPIYRIDFDKKDKHQFKDERANYKTPPVDQVILRNTGTEDTGEIKLALSGENKDAFDIGRTSIPNIKKGENLSFTIAPKPGLKEGSYRAVLSASGEKFESKSFELLFTVKKDDEKKEEEKEKDKEEKDKEEKGEGEDAKEGAKPPFTDIRVSDWYYEHIAYVYEKGLMNGTGEASFSPNESTSRGMIVTMLYRLAGEPKVAQSLPFADVKDDAYYAKAIAWAYENEIVKGYDEKSFGPNDSITREQMAIILMKYAKLKGADVSKIGDLSSFKDVYQISSFAREGISWAHAEGLITGKGENMLDPKGKALRSQVAAIIHRFVEKMEQQ